MHDLLRSELPIKIFTKEKQTAFRSNSLLKILISHIALDVHYRVFNFRNYSILSTKKGFFLKQNTAAVYIFPKLCYRPTIHILKYIFKYFFEIIQAWTSSLFMFIHV